MTSQPQHPLQKQSVHNGVMIEIIMFHDLSRLHRCIIGTDSGIICQIYRQPGQQQEQQTSEKYLHTGAALQPGGKAGIPCSLLFPGVFGGLCPVPKSMHHPDSKKSQKAPQHYRPQQSTSDVACRPQDVSRRCQVFFCFCKKYKQTSQNTQQYNAFASGKNFLFLHITTLYAPDAPHGRDSGDIQNLSGPWPP